MSDFLIPHDRAMTVAERMQRYRAKARAEGRVLPTEAPGTSTARVRRWRERHNGDVKPFCGVDGEGAGTDEHGRQCYMLLRCGDRELYTGNPLSTYECLEFLCSQPASKLLVGFGFNYDVTMILKDLAPDKRRWLLLETGEKLIDDAGKAHTKERWSHYEDFGIDYLPRNHFKVCRLRPVRLRKMDSRGNRMKWKPIAGTTRVIYDSIGCFQSSFLAALQSYNIGREHWDRIAAGKAARDNQTAIGDVERAYCAAEVALLGDLMERFRDTCHAAGIYPLTWNGAGKLAAFLHAKHSTPRTERVEALIPAAVECCARASYYGGRFEISRVGLITDGCHEYDINSAYPDAMRHLPCLQHGRWEPVTAVQLEALPDEALFVASLTFRHDGPGAGHFFGLPVRQHTGRLFWPGTGGGIYWSPEIRSAERRGCRVTYRPITAEIAGAPVGPYPEAAGWLYRTGCTCEPFDWVEPLYAYRKTLPKAQGIPIKLAINSLYGKLAQRIGVPEFQNFVWGGLVTALVRARLNDTIGRAPDQIIMVATDGIISKTPLTLPVGDGLGQWGHSEHDRLFVVQPGVYWKPSTAAFAHHTDAVKSRGMHRSVLERHARDFEAAWLDYAKWSKGTFGRIIAGKVLEPPSVTVDVRMFIGLRLAQARGKPETAGRWADTQRSVSFSWKDKRGRGRAWDGQCAITYPPPGAVGLESLTYNEAGDLWPAFDLDRIEREEQPDHFVWLDKEETP